MVRRDWVREVAKHGGLYAVLVPVSIVMEVMVAVFISYDLAYQVAKAVPVEGVNSLLFQFIDLLEILQPAISQLKNLLGAGVYYAILSLLFFVAHFLPSLTVLTLVIMKSCRRLLWVN